MKGLMRLVQVEVALSGVWLIAVGATGATAGRLLLPLSLLMLGLGLAGGHRLSLASRSA